MAITGHSAEKYVTGQLLDCSRSRNWAQLLAERWIHQAGELPSVLPRETEIAISLRGRAIVERRGNGVYQRVAARRGTTWLCPSGILEEDVNISGVVGDCLTLHIYLPAQPFADSLLQDFDIDASRASLRYASIEQDMFIEQIAQAIVFELDAETSGGRLLVESLSTTLSAYLVRRYAETDVKFKAITSSCKPLDGRRLSRVVEFVDAHILDAFTVADMARTACLSTAHFSRAFKATTGQAPHQFVSGRRLDLAKTLLKEAHLPLSEIAHVCGFSSEANFSRAFRKGARMTPGQYRKDPSAR